MKDYLKSQQDMSKALMSGAINPQARATPLSGLSRLATALMAYRNQNQTGQGLEQIKQGEKDQSQLDIARALGAARGDTPYQPDPSMVSGFEGDQLPTGLKTQGTGNDMQAFAQALAGSTDPSLQKVGLTGMMAGVTDKKPSSVAEYEYIQNLSPADQKKFMDVKRSPGAKVLDLGDKYRVIDGNSNVIGEFTKGVKTEDTPEYRADVAAREQEAKEKKKGEYTRWNTQMDEGLKAADGIPILRRSLTLLNNGVKTGGWDSIKLKVSNAFGVTGEDEAELSANLGRAVLSQLRSIFGAAFTEREGARLEFIEANFGKSTKGNIRLLEQLEKLAIREAERGIQAAESAGDKVRAKQIRESMDFSVEPDQDQKPVITSMDQYDALPSGALFIEDGKEYRKP